MNERTDANDLTLASNSAARKPFNFLVPLRAEALNSQLFPALVIRSLYRVESGEIYSPIEAEEHESLRPSVPLTHAD